MQYVELFKSIQGEGYFSGQPSIFARVSGCNLRCVFAGGSICDTAYTSFAPESPSYTDQDLIDMINANPQIHHVVFTGGEPLLYRDELDKVVGDLYEMFPDIVITIETNGTQEPLEHRIDVYSISPKLKTSVPSCPCTIEIEKGKTFEFTQDMIDKYNQKRIDIERLGRYIIQDSMPQLKFVYSGPESLEEISDIVDRLREDFEDIDEFVMLMPEGQTESQLQQRREEAAKICVEKGWIYTDRLQILIWGQKRNV